MLTKTGINMLRDSLLELREGMSLIISLDEEKVKALDYLAIKQQSIQSLFRMLMMENTEIANSINATKVIELYASTEYERRKLLDEIILAAIGKDNYLFLLEEGLFWRIDSTLDCLIIEKPRLQQGEETKECSARCQ